jgi:hypothetical protein
MENNINVSLWEVFDAYVSNQDTGDSCLDLVREMLINYVQANGKENTKELLTKLAAANLSNKNGYSEEDRENVMHEFDELSYLCKD